MTAPAAELSSKPHGHLPAWRQADLPEPLPYSFANAMRTIGPGAILLAAAIGGGEWIVGPMMMVKYGPAILWVATTAIVLQALFNMEGVRYTLYTGEPIITGAMRLWPGRWLWAPFYIVIGIAQLGTPALALGCASVLYSTAVHRELTKADLPTQHNIATVLIVGTVILLLSGKKVERVLEVLSWAMIAFIFTFLIYVNVAIVPFRQSVTTFGGFVTPRPLPPGVDLFLLASFAATAGAGGLGNLVISSWFRDKGFGMGKYMGAIGGLLAGDRTLEPTGFVFPTTPENMSRWRTWWRYAQLDQIALWAAGCVLGMFLNVNLAAFIVDPAHPPSNENAGVFQAIYMEQHLGTVFYGLALLNGFWVLYSTHLGNTDCLVRTVCDTLWSSCPPIRRFPAGRIYAVLLIVITAWGLVAVRQGGVVQLFQRLAVIANPIMAVAAVQILIVNRKFLPKELQPPLWRQAALVVCALVYGGFTVLMVRQVIADFWKT